MSDDESLNPPHGDGEKALLLQSLDKFRSAVSRKLDGLDDDRARWRPDDHLISLLGIVNHLTRVEWRWIDGGFFGTGVNRSEDEFQPGPDLTVEIALRAYQERADATDATIRSLDLNHRSAPESWAQGHDVRWVVLHLITETARHAGHADATRELLDGTTGE
jgi:uncharacterized damage-inducible protein DinB